MSKAPSIRSDSLTAMAELERRWTGEDRRPDLDHWASVPESRPFAVVFGGEPVAVGLRRRRVRTPDLWLDHVQVAPGVEPLSALLAAFRFGAAEGREIGGCVPGPSPVLAPLVEAGYRLFDHDTFMASAGSPVDPSARWSTRVCCRAWVRSAVRAASAAPLAANCTTLRRRGAGPGGGARRPRRVVR